MKLQIFFVSVLGLTFAFLGLSRAMEVGATTPSWELASLKGDKKFSSKDFKGNVVLLDFWASWCGPCKEAIPFYETLFKKYKKGSPALSVIGVNVDDVASEGLEFLKTQKTSFPMVWDEGKKLAQKLNVSVMPTTFLISPSGKIFKVHRGFKEKDKAKIEAEIKSLLSTQP